MLRLADFDGGAVSPAGKRLVRSIRDSEIVLTSSLWREVPRRFSGARGPKLPGGGNLGALVRDVRNRYWMTRAKTTSKWTVLESMAPGDDLIELQISAEGEAMDPMLPVTYVARATPTTQRIPAADGADRLMDAKQYPAKDVVARYHERWELELGYDEIKTEMLDNQQETGPSRTVDGVGQELWGIPLAYNLIRTEMERTADDLGVEPTQISFTLRCASSATPDLCSIASAGAIPTRLNNDARTLHTAGAACQTTEPKLSQGREDQDDQLRAQAPRPRDRS